MIGTVRWFNLQKGYGFIHPDDGSPNIFVHMSTVESAGMSDLKEGRRVIFESHRDERTGDACAVSLKPFVFETTPPLDDRYAITNPFDIISAFISSNIVDALAVVKGATRSRIQEGSRQGGRMSFLN
jgi:CspA family cold shock protein